MLIWYFVYFIFDKKSCAMILMTGGKLSLTISSSSYPFVRKQFDIVIDLTS